MSSPGARWPPRDMAPRVGSAAGGAYGLCSSGEGRGLMGWAMVSLDVVSPSIRRRPLLGSRRVAPDPGAVVLAACRRPARRPRGAALLPRAPGGEPVALR